jgi:GNAT superfamily N-acetyltransferase
LKPIVESDVDAVVGLFEEMDQFYGNEPAGSAADRADQVRKALFGRLPAALALGAWQDTILEGIAAYSYLWPAVGVSRSLYLKELYVAQSHRRRGAGKLLMDGLHEIAKAEKCSRVEWTTDRPNVAAQDFYASLGFKAHESKLFYRSTL